MKSSLKKAAAISLIASTGLIVAQNALADNDLTEGGNQCAKSELKIQFNELDKQLLSSLFTTLNESARSREVLRENLDTYLENYPLSPAVKDLFFSTYEEIFRFYEDNYFLEHRGTMDAESQYNYLKDNYPKLLKFLEETEGQVLGKPLIKYELAVFTNEVVCINKHFIINTKYTWDVKGI